MSDLCLECREPVRALQHGITCDICDQWQHRTCNTGISRDEYFKARKELIVINFTCRSCTCNETTLPPQVEDIISDDQGEVGQTSFDVSNDHGVTFNLDFSTGTNDNSVTDDLPFDVTRDGEADTSAMLERSIGEPALSDSVVENEAEVVYQLVEEGTQRKRFKLVSSDGFSYCKKKETKSSVHWRCSVRRKGLLCYANVTQRGDIFSCGQSLHNHDPDPLIAKKVTLQRDVRREALRDVHAPSGRVVEGLMTATFNEKGFNLPRPVNLVRTLNRARQKQRPAEPTSLDFEFDSDFLQEDFLVGDIKVGEERHMMFSTEAQLQILASSRKWYLDGTFRVIKKPFSQLWSIHCFIRQGEAMKQVPVLYVLMSKRRKQDYVAVLRKILEILDTAPVVEGFAMDFEVGLWQALREVFPGTALRGCGFHWAQAIQRKVQEVGLQTTYQRREGAHPLIRKLLALPFLPGRDIQRAFQKLKDRADESSQQMRDLFTYVHEQWLDSSLWTEEEWSVYRQPIRTNNDTEGWHRRLNARAGRGNVSFYVLLKLLLQESKMVPLHVQLVSEEAVSRRRREVYRSIDEKIDQLWQEYDDHEIVCEEFLKQVGNLYNP